MAWQKGECGNLKGRPVGSANRFSLYDLHKALDRAKNNHGGVSLLDHLCNIAYVDNTVAIAILKKMLPDLKRTEATVDVDVVGFAKMTPAEAAQAMDNLTTGNNIKKDVATTKLSQRTI